MTTGGVESWAGDLAGREALRAQLFAVATEEQALAARDALDAWRAAHPDDLAILDAAFALEPWEEIWERRGTSAAA